MIYNQGLDRLNYISDSTVIWMLLKDNAYTFDPDHENVSDLTPGTNEVTVTGYSRLPLSGGSRVVENANDRIVYKGDNPNFGSLDGGESVTGLSLFYDQGSDASSLLIGYWQFAPRESDLIDPFIVYFQDRIITYVSEG